MAQLSEWLQIMLAEIGRKQDEARANAASAPATIPTTPSSAPTSASTTPDKRAAAV